MWRSSKESWVFFFDWTDNRSLAKFYRLINYKKPWCVVVVDRSIDGIVLNRSFDLNLMQSIELKKKKDRWSISDWFDRKRRGSGEEHVLVIQSCSLFSIDISRNINQVALPFNFQRGNQNKYISSCVCVCVCFSMNNDYVDIWCIACSSSSE